MNYFQELKESGEITQVLIGHDNFENAYLVDDYPYGFTLRTKIKYWVEKNKNGSRLCTCTLNPKTGKWNKPKKSTYSSLLSIYLDKKGYVQSCGMSTYNYSTELLNLYLELFGESLKDEFSQAQIKKMRIAIEARKYIKVDYVIGETPTQTEAEKNQILQNAWNQGKIDAGFC